MAMSDSSLGKLLLSSAAAGFMYYTIWTLLLPFFNVDSPIHGWFPAREWAVRIPAVAIVLGISSCGMFIGFRALEDRARHSS